MPRFTKKPVQSAVDVGRGGGGGNTPTPKVPVKGVAATPEVPGIVTIQVTSHEIRLPGIPPSVIPANISYQLQIYRGGGTTGATSGLAQQGAPGFTQVSEGFVVSPTSNTWLRAYANQMAQGQTANVPVYVKFERRLVGQRYFAVAIVRYRQPQT